MHAVRTMFARVLYSMHNNILLERRVCDGIIGCSMVQCKNATVYGMHVRVPPLRFKEEHAFIHPHSHATTTNSVVPNIWRHTQTPRLHSHCTCIGLLATDIRYAKDAGQDTAVSELTMYTVTETTSN